PSLSQAHQCRIKLAPMHVTRLVGSQVRRVGLGRRMSRGDTGKGRPYLGVKVRRALTQQIGCVLFELGGTGNIPYCSSNQTKDGRIRYLILDATNLNLRSLLESPSFVL